MPPSHVWHPDPQKRTKASVIFHQSMFLSQLSRCVGLPRHPDKALSSLPTLGLFTSWVCPCLRCSNFVVAAEIATRVGIPADWLFVASLRGQLFMDAFRFAGPYSHIHLSSLSARHSIKLKPTLRIMTKLAVFLRDKKGVYRPKKMFTSSSFLL